MPIYSSGSGGYVVGMTKICKKYDIPKPGLGYWAKLEHGKHVEKKALPNRHINPEITIDVSGKYQEMFRSDAMKSQMTARLQDQFKVPDTLNDPHPLIQQTRKIRNENKDTYYTSQQILNPFCMLDGSNGVKRSQKTTLSIFQSGLQGIHQGQCLGLRPVTDA